MKTSDPLLILVVSLVAAVSSLGQPVITTQPRPQTNNLGTTATFSVGATGTPPLSYQWRSYASAAVFTNIVDATEATLVLTNVQPTSRRFGVVVTNPEGSTPSASAQLIVLIPPRITQEPQDITAVAGETATFIVEAMGTAPLRFQWRQEASNLTGQTNSTLELLSLQTTNAGDYSVVVSNAAASITSRVAVLQMIPQTTFTKVTTGHIATNFSSSFGAAWGDFNNDGFEDLFVASVGGRNDLLYLNNTNGTFTPILTGEIVNDGKESFCANWADYDNDGYLDLFVTIRGFPETNRLYRNAGDGTFTKVTSGDVVTESHNGFMFGSAWGDYDNDGFIDLFVAKTGGGIPAGKRDLLYRNDGAGSFNRVLTGPISEVSDVSGGCAWGDYNNDGKLDLFVVNTTTNFLFRNDGHGVFTQITAGTISTDRGVSEHPAWADYNNDGFLDLFVTYGGRGAVATNALYRNTGTGTFARVTSGIIATDAGNFVGGSWGDYDNNGFLDLIVSQYSGRKNILYRNNGDGTFSRITTGSIVNDPGDSNATVWGDYDNDGFLDLFVTNGSTETTQYTHFLYHNDGNSNQWLKIKCVGGPSNRAAIGAKVRVQVQTGGGALTWQMREISGGNGLSQNSLIAHFGLGHATHARTVRIEWPSGIVQVLTNVTAKQFLTVTEPPLLPAGMTNGSFQILLTGSVGLSYGIEASTNLTGWIPVGSVTNTTRIIRFADPTATNSEQRFYRAVLK